MKRLVATGLLLLILSSLSHAQFAIFQTYLPSATPNPNLRQENFFGITGNDWLNFTGNYTPGLGNPAVATDDYYHQNGLSGFRPYDLTASECGSAGASIAASRGRYAWPLFADHGSGSGVVWNGSFNFRLGYSNDPGVLPSTMASLLPIDLGTASPAISTITASISNGSGGPGNILNVTAYTGLITNAGQASVSGAGVTTAVISSQSSGTSGETGNYVIGGSPQLVASQTMTVSQANYGLYYDAQLVCNPDDVTYPFYIYAEGNASSVQHQMGVIKSADLLTWTTAVPTHNALNFGTWSSFQRINRVGTGNWVSKGYQIGYPQNGNVSARSTWTSTDGNIWAPGTTNLNWCLPASSQSGTTVDCTGASRKVEPAQSPDTITVSASSWIMGKISTYSGSTRVGDQWVGRAAVDANQSVIDSPAAVAISAPYAGNYPGPTYLQTVTGYAEDGIAHYYAAKGWPISNQLWGQVYLATYANGGLCSQLPAVNGQQGQFQVVGSISGTTLTVSSVPVGSVVAGGQIYGGGISNSNITIIQPFGTGGTTGVGGTGTYAVSVSQTVGSNTFSGTLCGGLWQQGLDYYTEIIDASAAAGAAPVGAKASCASSVASLTWFNALPTQTYRLYRGTSAGSQPTLVGDFTGTSATDSGMTLNSVTYYKLVYLNGGVEQKHRVVSTYCSTSSAFVNAHLTRALAAGADATTCNRTWMDTFDGWLTSNSRTSNLQFATMADFCVAKSGSVISKIFDMGTTRLPRGGDYTPTTGNTTYSATGINSKPAWVNGANTAQGYYGGGLVNNIRRKTQITLFAAYQKPGTAQITPLAWGEVGGMKMTHVTGSPGSISCTLYDATHPVTATATVAGLATDVHTAACTFDGTNLTAYSDGVAGAAQSGLVIPSPNLNPPDSLTGNIGVSNEMPFLGSGSASSKYISSTGAYIFSNNEALYSGRAQMVFDVGLPQGEIASLDALVR